MSLMDWWRREQAKPSAEAGVRGAINQKPIKGLNVEDAVSAHAAWKERLFHYVNGTSKEQLDENVICRDDACVLGKWIHGDARSFLSEVPDYHRLKSAHAAFHVAAADVVRAVNANNAEKAERLLVEGPFSEQSRDVQMMLAKLYAKLGAE